MNVFSDPLRELEAYNIIRNNLETAGESPGGTDRPRGILADGCVDTQKVHLLYALCREESIAPHARLRLVLTHSDLRAREIARDCSFYDKNVGVYPARDLIFYQADLRSGEIDRERIRCLRRILEGKPMTVVTTFAALLTPQIPARVLRDSILGIGRRETVDLQDITRRLVSMGYEKNYQVERGGQFAVRGDILDIFDLSQDNPVRIELWGDEVETIRSFDVLSQRSVEQLEYIRVFPASEMILEERRLRDGLSRMKREAERVCAQRRERGEQEAAHRLSAEIARICEEAQELHIFSGLESCIHYFYPMTESLLDLFPPEETIVFLDEPVRILQHARAVETEFRESMISRAEKGYVLPGQMDLIRETPAVVRDLERRRRLGFAVLAGVPEKSPAVLSLPEDPVPAGSGISALESAGISAQGSVGVSVPASAGAWTPDAAGSSARDGGFSLRFDLTVRMHARDATLSGLSYGALREELARLRRKKERVIIVSPSRTRARRLAEDLTADDVIVFYRENILRTLKPGEIMTFAGRMRKGFSYPEIGFTVLTEAEIFGEEKKKRRPVKRYSGGEQIRNFSELKAGDYVVHEHYGIGIYRGLEKIVVDHIARDYVKIEYGAGGILYVLPTDLSVLQKYAAAEGARKPKLNRLGTMEWSRTRGKVQKAVEEVADDLVELYAKRQARQGHIYGKDTVWQRELEEMFPYEETEDQLAAIEDTKRDMESSRIMDRLICGDVGYGKTEIAVRAAFKAVQEGMQVAVLVPTTVLAQQHYNTFSERMHNFPVNIEVLSRFRTAKEQKKVLHDLERGMVDIVVGTHRLLSKDVKFKNLGLLVVDEEQRFGVTHKEKIKKLKEDVDVLTLSATPIPRTLHMSMVGIRDMSVLEQAPQDRLPIQTYVMEYNEELVREAISRELARRGQVYYVHNRVNDIARAAVEVQALVPGARVAYAHGQMKESELEKIMYDFISGQIDILVSTTIIETGLDISNVNTIIISDADKLGLSQLYQLRGRVGRTNRTAYAFLMYRRGQILREVAEKRLAAIREFTDLGSGFRIAMRDLEIRGAGSILGRVQHGHMQAVGYDLYCKLLEDAVRKAKGEAPKEEKNVSVNLLVEAYMPDHYITGEEQKLEIYKRIAAIDSVADVEDVRDELLDRYGEIPLPARNLLRVALIRSVASRLDIIELNGGSGRLTIVPDPQARGLKVENIPLLLEMYKNRLSFTAKGGPQFLLTYALTGITVRDEETLLQAAEDLLVNMSKVLR
ncbi:MAG: transcription-repair coupling factor [Eubacteriales bacterium]|nr:transcription-repair coupling factor [Eubacteriales bacterium]